MKKNMWIMAVCCALCAGVLFVGITENAEMMSMNGVDRIRILVDAGQAGKHQRK